MARFSAQVALVTGAGSGIGAAVARALIAEGARLVVLADVDAGAAGRQAAALGPAAVAEQLDVTDAGQVDRLVGGTADRHGRLDVVVHAAGVDDPEAKQAIAEALTRHRPVAVTAGLPPASWRRVLAVNLDGTFHVLQAALRTMAAQARGAIVLIGSSAAFDAPTGYPHYAASKAGVHALGQAVAKEAIAWGVRVNIVAPGPTRTGMAERTPPALRASMLGDTVPPYATAEQIADSVLYLASDAASNIVGSILLSNGGRFTV